MGFYDVVKPCVVGKLHYVRPTTQPIEVDDDVAEPLIAEGCLQPYGVFVAQLGVNFVVEPAQILPASEPDAGTNDEASEVKPPRRGRRTGA